MYIRDINKMPILPQIANLADIAKKFLYGCRKKSSPPLGGYVVLKYHNDLRNLCEDSPKNYICHI